MEEPLNLPQDGTPIKGYHLELY